MDLRKGIDKIIKDTQIEPNKMQELAKKHDVLWYPKEMYFKTNDVNKMDLLAKELGFNGASDSDFDDYSGYYRLDLRR